MPPRAAGTLATPLSSTISSDIFLGKYYRIFSRLPYFHSVSVILTDKRLLFIKPNKKLPCHEVEPWEMRGPNLEKHRNRIRSREITLRFSGVARVPAARGGS